jgi:hypothetical protein
MAPVRCVGRSSRVTEVGYLKRRSQIDSRSKFKIFEHPAQLLQVNGLSARKSGANVRAVAYATKTRAMKALGALPHSIAICCFAKQVCNTTTDE